MFTASNDSSLDNATDLQQESTTDRRTTVERRNTEAVYIVVRYYVYQGITPAIMLVGVVGNLLSLVLGVRCRRQMSSLEDAHQSSGIDCSRCCCQGLRVRGQGQGLSSRTTILGGRKTLLHKQTTETKQNQQLSSLLHQRQMSSLERSASAGLIALVTSDLLFCAVGLPQLFVPERLDLTTPADSIPLARFRFYYEMYRGPLHNVFLLCSTWIVATITAERYLAVSRPIHARLLTIRLHRTLFFYVAVFCLSGVVVVPLFLKYRAVEGDCFPGCRCLYIVPTSTFGSIESRRVYNVVWMLVGVVLPLGCLLVAGTKLVQAMRAVRRRSNEIATARQGHSQRQHSGPSPVTMTVVGTAVSFIILVCPSIADDSFEIT